MIKEKQSKDGKYIVRNIFKSNNEDELKVHTRDAFTRIVIRKIKENR